MSPSCTFTVLPVARQPAVHAEAGFTWPVASPLDGGSRAFPKPVLSKPHGRSPIHAKLHGPDTRSLPYAACGVAAGLTTDRNEAIFRILNISNQRELWTRNSLRETACPRRVAGRVAVGHPPRQWIHQESHRAAVARRLSRRAVLERVVDRLPAGGGAPGPTAPRPPRGEGHVPWAAAAPAPSQRGSGAERGTAG